MRHFLFVVRTCFSITLYCCSAIFGFFTAFLMALIHIVRLPSRKYRLHYNISKFEKTMETLKNSSKKSRNKLAGKIKKKNTSKLARIVLSEMKQRRRNIAPEVFLRTAKKVNFHTVANNIEELAKYHEVIVESDQFEINSNLLALIKHE